MSKGQVEIKIINDTSDKIKNLSLKWWKVQERMDKLQINRDDLVLKLSTEKDEDQKKSLKEEFVKVREQLWDLHDERTDYILEISELVDQKMEAESRFEDILFKECPQVYNED